MCVCVRMFVYAIDAHGVRHGRKVRWYLMINAVIFIRDTKERQHLVCYTYRFQCVTRNGTIGNKIGEGSICAEAPLRVQISKVDTGMMQISIVPIHFDNVPVTNIFAEYRIHDVNEWFLLLWEHEPYIAHVEECPVLEMMLLETQASHPVFGPTRAHWVDGAHAQRAAQEMERNIVFAQEGACNVFFNQLLTRFQCWYQMTGTIFQNELIRLTWHPQQCRLCAYMERMHNRFPEII